MMQDTSLYGKRHIDKKTIAKLLSAVENNPFDAAKFLKELWAKSPSSHVIGITGAGGVGKSSIIASLTKYLTTRNFTVGIVAIDPSSPFSGGALLGDRVRMKGLGNKVFIRSMSTVNEEAIPWKALMAVEILEGVGFNYIIMETPGAGQFNVEVMKAVDTVVVVFMPGLGDDIQALKAGLMEIGDIYVVNKADMVGADLAFSQIEFAIGNKKIKGWKPRIVKTIGLSISGIQELIRVLEERENFLRVTKEYRVNKRASRRELEIKLFLTKVYRETLRMLLCSDKQLEELMVKVKAGEIDTITASRRIMNKLFNPNVIKEATIGNKEKNI